MKRKILLLSLVFTVVFIKCDYNSYSNKVYASLKEEDFYLKKFTPQEYKDVFEEEGMLSKQGFIVDYKGKPIKIVFYKYLNDRIGGNVSKKIYNWKLRELNPDKNMRYKYIFIFKEDIIGYIESPNGMYSYGEELYFKLRENNVL